MNTDMKNGSSCMSAPKFCVPASILRGAVLAAFVGSLALSGPVNAAPADNSKEPQQNALEQGASQTQAKKDDKLEHSAKKIARHVEDRIKTLHDKLLVTSAQEEKWGVVAQTMRDNEAAIAVLVEARHKNGASMTALDDLQSYENITQAHADGIKKMIVSFQALYNDMSDDQKKNADNIFGKYEGHGDKSSKKHK